MVHNWGIIRSPAPTARPAPPAPTHASPRKRGAPVRERWATWAARLSREGVLLQEFKPLDLGSQLVLDIAQANILAAEAPDVTGEVFNIASATETSLNDLARALMRVMGSNAPIEYGPERKVNPVPRRLADVSKAKRLLGFETTVSIEEGLRRLVAWWQAERAAKEAAR